MRFVQRPLQLPHRPHVPQMSYHTSSLIARYLRCPLPETTGEYSERNGAGILDLPAGSVLSILFGRHSVSLSSGSSLGYTSLELPLKVSLHGAARLHGARHACMERCACMV